MEETSGQKLPPGTGEDASAADPVAEGQAIEAPAASDEAAADGAPAPEGQGEAWMR